DAAIQHPEVISAMSGVKIAHQQRRLEAHRMLPDLTGRWFDQRIYGVEDRFRGYSISVGIPLFFNDPRSRVRAARVKERIAQEQADQLQADLQASYSAAVQRAEQARETFLSFETILNEQMQVLEQTSTDAYRAGEIGYIEMAALIAQSNELRIERIRALHELNAALIELDHFTGSLLPFTPKS